MESRFFSYKMMKKYVVAKTKYEQRGVSTKKSSRDIQGIFIELHKQKWNSFTWKKKRKKESKKGPTFRSNDSKFV